MDQNKLSETNQDSKIASLGPGPSLNILQKGQYYRKYNYDILLYIIHNICSLNDRIHILYYMFFILYLEFKLFLAA